MIGNCRLDGVIWPEQGQVARSCEHSNLCLGSITHREFCYKLRILHLLKESLD